MNLEIFTICNRASLGRDGMKIEGVFDYIRAEFVPFFSPSFDVVVRLRIASLEPDAGEVTIEIVDADGNPMIRPAIRRYIIAASGTIGGIYNAVFNCHGVRFDEAGWYSVNVAVNGRVEGALPLEVRSVPENVFSG